MRVIVCVLALSTFLAVGAHAGCKGGVVYLQITKDGTVTWNGVAFKDRKAMAERFKQAASGAEQPEIHLVPVREAEYHKVAEVLAEAQKVGLHCLGFVGLDQGKAD
jgi:biopolymer transport protein ExbD